MKITGAIYLMRHGRTALDVAHRSDGWLDLPLSADGQLSVIPAQQRLKTVPLKTIYAPTLKRTKETAHLVASGTLSEPEIEHDDDARTWNLGVLAGTRKRYGRPAVQRLIDNPDRAPLGGESFNDFKGRFMPWFDKVADSAVDSNEPVLIVCSGSNLRLLGKELLDDADCLDLDEGGLAVLWHADDCWHGEIFCGAKPGKSNSGQVANDLQDGAKAAIDEAFERGMT